MGKIVYCCPFVPPEWIAAHGLEPCRITPSRADAPKQGLAEGICPYAFAFALSACAEPDGAGIVVTTVCDQMRRMAERISRDASAPTFLMNVPATWESVAAHRMYREELLRLGRFLVRLGGRTPSAAELSGVMADYDLRRDELRGLAGRLSSRAFAEALARFHYDGTLPPAPTGQSLRRGVPLALIGGPLMRGHMALFDAVESAGGCVALDATGGGERALPAPFDRRLLNDDPVTALCEAYFDAIPDAFRRPDTLLYQWLGRHLALRQVRGIIFWRYVGCDLWHAELHRLKEWAGLPVLDVEAGEEAALDGHALSRIESFLEMLR